MILLFAARPGDWNLSLVVAGCNTLVTRLMALVIHAPVSNWVIRIIMRIPVYVYANCNVYISEAF